MTSADSAGSIDRRFLLGGLAGAAGVSALAAMAKAGPINPPAGAVASTGKTLTDIEPRKAISGANTPGDADSTYKITSPGSYYLTDDVGVAAGKSGIEITASNVTVDLNGFQIYSLGGAAGVIVPNATQRSVTVRNGRIRLMAIGVSAIGVTGITLEDLRIESCTGRGASLGQSARIGRCAFVSNGDDGALCDEGACVKSCLFSDNDGDGLYVYRGAINGGGQVCDCLAEGNGGDGIRAAGSITGCAALRNGQLGIAISDGGVASNCAAIENTRAGFYVQEGQALGCTATENGAAGFVIGFYGRVAGCLAQANGTGSASSEAAGFTLSGRYARIEDCHSCGNLYGYRTAGGGTVDNNFIVRNTAAFNTTNWSIRAGNTCLVVAAASTTVDFSGNSGGVAPGSTNPYVNYTL